LSEIGERHGRGNLERFDIARPADWEEEDLAGAEDALEDLGLAALAVYAHLSKIKWRRTV
jgi:hypothetical protein